MRRYTTVAQSSAVGSKGDAFASTVVTDELLIPPPDHGDNTAPSGTSAAVELLARLYATTDNVEYRLAAARAFAHLSGAVRQYPMMWASATVAVNRYPFLVSTGITAAYGEGERRRRTDDTQQRRSDCHRRCCLWWLSASRGAIATLASSV
jgi:uncharacterized protein YyaL (SSP411 family)